MKIEHLIHQPLFTKTSKDIKGNPSKRLALSMGFKSNVLDLVSVFKNVAIKNKIFLIKKKIYNKKFFSVFSDCLFLS